MTRAPSRRAWDEEPEAPVTVKGTGDAEAAGDATAVTGYRGPEPGNGRGPVPSVKVAGTGDAIASGGISNTGYIHQAIGTLVQRAPQNPASWPHQVGVIPSSARSFQHRAEADRLRAVVDGGGTAVLSQVLTGMGGVGKTQLAAEYARCAWDEGGLDVLVWVTASDRSSVVSTYAQAGVELCRADPDDPEQAAKTFLAWLVPKPGQRPCRWLIVLDNVNDPGDLVDRPEDPGNCYSLWPPTSPHGRTLLTTRRRDSALFGQDRRRIDVGLFTPDESAAYLTAALDAQNRTEPADQLTALATDLGHLPMALAQAAAYLIDSGVSAATYRELLADRTTRLADLTPDSLPDEQATALDAAWSLSIDRADTLGPVGLARPMLHLASLLDANGIPQDVLTSEPARAHLAAHRTATSSPGPRRRKWWPNRRQRPSEPTPPATLRETVDVLRVLDRLSLIDHQPSTPHPSVRIHQLIQRATRDPHTSQQHDQAAHVAADALIAAWPSIERDTDLAQVMRINGAALTHHAEDALYWPDVHVVLYRLGRSLGESGRVTAAIDYFEYLADSVCTRHGVDHPDVLRARNNVASWRGKAGDAAGAAQAFAELLEPMVRVFGEDHPDVLRARNSHASWLGEAGDAAGAAQAFAELLEPMVRVRGEDHPDTFVIRNNLASWRGETGDAVGAAQAFAELLEPMVRVFGEDHPDTFVIRNNLASWRGEAGDAVGAVQAFAELLEHMVRVFGEDHPDVLRARNNLASWLGETGDAAGAAQAFAELLEHMVRVFDEDHPDTFAIRNNLASWRGETGDAVGAAQAFAELLEHMVRVFDEDHPDVLRARNNLASWRGEAGDAVGAVQAFAELLEHMVRVFGEDHPDTFSIRNNLASWRGETGDAVGAAQAFAELLEHMVRVLGEDHPDTFSTRKNLARWVKDAESAPDSS